MTCPQSLSSLIPAKACAFLSPPLLCPTDSHPHPQKNGTYLGLTWDLLGTHLPTRTDGIVSET